MSNVEYFDTQCVCICDTDQRKANMASALARGYPVVEKLESNWRPLAIVGGGPSVADDVEELRNWKSSRNGEIWACNGALDWLMERGIKPDGFVMIDPHPSKVADLKNPPDGVTYYIASICDPAVFDALAGKDVVIWHQKDPENKPPKGQGWVGGGPTVLTRAPLVAYCLGWRDVHLFGADSSFETKETHAYPMQLAEGVTPDEGINVLLDGVLYSTSVLYVHQTAYFQAIHAWFVERGARFAIHGRGLGPAILKAKLHQLEEIAA